MTVAASTRKHKKRRRYNANAGIFLVTVIMICFAVVMSFRAKALQADSKRYHVQEATLQKNLDEEIIRGEELEESRAYVQTRDYIERMAREKLGLINPDETIVKPNE